MDNGSIMSALRLMIPETLVEDSLPLDSNPDNK